MTNSMDVRIVGGLLALALLVGGAGISFPHLEMLLQLCSLAAVAYLIVTPRTWRFGGVQLLALVIFAGILLLPLAQLVPLPPEVWSQLPGRALAVQVDAALGSSHWRPISLDVEGTVRSFLRLLPAAAIFLGCLFLRRAERERLLWVVLAGALISAVLGMVQMVTGGWLTPYPSGHLGYPLGFFVNRNHQAALLLIAVPIATWLAAAQIAHGKPQIPWISGALSAILIFALVALGTTSRMGLMLLPLSIAAGLLILFNGRTSRMVFGAATAIGVVWAVLLAQGGFDRVLSRFDDLDDLRLDFWADLNWALAHYGLVGTGFGTFIPVFKSAESLESVTSKITNHAHNDYLEILLEGGIPAVLILVLFLIFLAKCLTFWVKGGTRRDQKLATGAAAAGLAVLAAWSGVDYPLRMPALSAILALHCALLLPIRSRSKALVATPSSQGENLPAVPDGTTRVALRYRAAGLLVLVPLFVAVIQSGVSAQHLRSSNFAQAAQSAQWSTQAHERLANEALLQGRLATAHAHAAAAVGLSPINAPAIRTLGLLRLSQGATSQGNDLMRIASLLGWRDPLAQLWAIEAALRSREPKKAVERAEAVFRQRSLVAAATTQLLSAPAQSGTLELLSSRVADRPDWRSAFFEAAAALPPSVDDTWVRLVELLARTKAPVTRAEAEPSLEALISRGQTDKAQRLWRALHGRNLISNGDFEAIDASSLPSDWHVPQRRRADIAIRVPPTGANGRALHIRGSGGSVIMQQQMMLQPGTYILALRALGGGGARSTLRWELRCDRSREIRALETIVPGTEQWHKFELTLTVPFQDCAIQSLALRRLAAEEEEDSLWLDDLRLESKHSLTP